MLYWRVSEHIVLAQHRCQMDEEQTLQTTALKAKHRTTPLAASITPVPGYPRKLTIYQLEASSYWWVRYYTDGKIVRRSSLKIKIKPTSSPRLFTTN